MNLLHSWKYLLCYIAHFILSNSSLSFSWYLSIIKHVLGNVSPPNFSTKYYSDKVSLAMLLSVMYDLINVTILEEFCASLPVSYIYLIVGVYYSNRKLHISTLSIVKLLYMIFLWYIYTVILCTDKMLHNYFRVSTILNSYLSVVL